MMQSFLFRVKEPIVQKIYKKFSRVPDHDTYNKILFSFIFFFTALQFLPRIPFSIIKTHPSPARFVIQLNRGHPYKFMIQLVLFL